MVEHATVAIAWTYGINGADWHQVLKVEAYLDTVSRRCDMCELIPVKVGLVARVGEESIKGGRWTWA